MEIYDKVSKTLLISVPFKPGLGYAVTRQELQIAEQHLQEIKRVGLNLLRPWDKDKRAGAARALDDQVE